MRQISLNGVFYPIHSDIISRRINPWKAKLGAGSLEYSDFSQAEMEEYFDFRNGIGKKRGVGSDARLDWTEGIDFSVEGQAVLGPKVNTAGAFGVAPVKIIDFESGTYAIGSSQISKWNTGTSAWDSKDTSLASPIDAIVVTDSTDSYLIVSSATDAVYTTDGETWTALWGWKSPVSATDPDSEWADEAYTYDGNTATKALNSTGADGYLELNLTTAVVTDRVRVFLGKGADSGTPTVTIDLYYDSAWHNIFASTIAYDQWVTKTNSAGLKTVSKARIKYTNTVGGKDYYIYEVAFYNPVFGYLADFENKLYCISTDGKFVGYSVAKNIDSFSGSFELTGNYGTLYRFFEGKLLADGTPTLYFCGTEGLYSLDTTTEIAYKQEVSYPPITNAGNVGIYWNANVWVSTGYGILKIAPSVATFIGPDQDDGLPSGYQGKVYDFATVNNWLVFCVNGGTTDKSSILKRNSTLGGNLQVYTTSAINKAIACLCYSPSSLYTNGRLWFGEGTDVKYMMFPDTTSNVKQLDTYEYVNDSGYGKLPIFRKVAAIPKTALGVAAITKSCSAVDKIEVYYGLNGAAPTTLLGTFTSSPKPTALTFGSGLGAAFYTIQFATKLYRGDDLITNGTFTSDITGWTDNSGSGSSVAWSASYGGSMEMDGSAAYANADQAITTAVGAEYIVKVTVKSFAGANLSIQVGTTLGGTDLLDELINSAAVHSFTFIATGTTTYIRLRSGLDNNYVDDVSVMDTSPELESLMFYWLPVPTTILSWQFRIQCTDENSAETIAALEAIRDTQTLVAFYPSGDTAKTSYNVKLTQLGERLMYEEQGAKEGYLEIILEQVFIG